MISDKKNEKTINDVKEYYGKVLASNKDLKTSACCTADSPLSHIRAILKQVHTEVLDRFYGCGSPIPEVLEGKTVLDLGSGSGRDCFVLSSLVGEKGRVIGVDMTPEQIAVAKKYESYHAEKFGHKKPNTEFHHGYIEDLQSIGLKDNSVDLVVSNCVLNLSPAKEKVFKEIYRVLKPGGELYFSDVFSDRRIPTKLAADPVLLGECLGGALYTEDFRRIMISSGFADFRSVAKAPITLNDPEVIKKIGMVKFYSITYRAFKLNLEDRCEDYGQVAYYLGTIPGFEHHFALDDHHLFETGKPMTVCSNTAAMVMETRFAPHFKVVGDTSVHYGLFDCGPSPLLSNPTSTVGGACC